MNEAMGLTAADVAAVTRNDGYDSSSKSFSIKF